MLTDERTQLFESEIYEDDDGIADFVSENWGKGFCIILLIVLVVLAWQFVWTSNPKAQQFRFVAADVKDLQPGVPIVLGRIAVGEVTTAPTAGNGNEGQLQLSQEIAQRLPADSVFTLVMNSHPDRPVAIHITPGELCDHPLPKTLRIVTANNNELLENLNFPEVFDISTIPKLFETVHQRPSSVLLMIAMAGILLLTLAIRWAQRILVRLILLVVFVLATVAFSQGQWKALVPTLLAPENSVEFKEPVTKLDR